MNLKGIIKKKRILVSRVYLLFVAFLVLFSASAWEDIGLWSTVFFLLGAFLVGVATIGRLWCSLYISGYKSGTLITTGPYSMCRNPLYFFSFMGAVGVGLATETLLIPFFVIIGFLLYYPLVIKQEQKRLSEIHGQAYKEYCERTPVFLPFLKRLKEPEQYVVNAKIFRKSLFDAMWFVWLIGLLELTEALHESSLLPTWMKLY